MRDSGFGADNGRRGSTRRATAVRSLPRSLAVTIADPRIGPWALACKLSVFVGDVTSRLMALHFARTELIFSLLSVPKGCERALWQVALLRSPADVQFMNRASLHGRQQSNAPPVSASPQVRDCGEAGFALLARSPSGLKVSARQSH